MLLLYRFFRMHGRVKVKTDSQKAEEKKQRRLEQLEQFKFARTKIDQLFSSIQKVNCLPKTLYVMYHFQNTITEKRSPLL